MDHAVLTDVEEDNFPLSDHRAVISDAFLMNIQETKREEIIKFSIVYNTSPGEEVYVVGSLPELGNWNIQNAKRMQWTNGNNWISEVRLKKVDFSRGLLMNVGSKLRIQICCY